MRMLTMENESWKFACGAYDWMKLNLGFSQTTTEIDNLVSTIMQVFVLKINRVRSWPIFTLQQKLKSNFLA